MEFHVFTTHRCHSDDDTPLHLVSAERMRYYLRAEAVAAASGALLVGGALVVAILYVRGFIAF